MDQLLGVRFARKGQLILLLVTVFLIVLFIVKNGNMLTDRTNERKYLQRKYNDL